MEKKIIELTKVNDGCQCILCCTRNATIKFTVNRVKYDEALIAFYVCDICLARMQKDIEVCR